MDFSKLALFQAMQRKMDWLTQRHELLARNVANADTPLYTPSDLKPLTFEDALGRSRTHMRPASTHEGHLSGGRIGAKGAALARTTATYEAAPSGNKVVLEEQLMKVTETAADHQLVTNLYKKQLAMIRSVLGRGV